MREKINQFFYELKLSLGRYNPDAMISQDQKDIMINDMFYKERRLVNSAKSAEEIDLVKVLVINQLCGSELEKRFQEMILTDLDEKIRSRSSKNKEMKL